MTNPTFLRPLALAALALLAATPTSALAAPQPKTAFRIVVEGTARLEQFPTLPPAYEWDFRAWGAIKDSGTLGATGTNWVELWGQHATYVALFDGETSTFTLWQPNGGTWPGTLLGSGTYTGEQTINGWTIRQRWELEGSLVGG